MNALNKIDRISHAILAFFNMAEEAPAPKVVAPVKEEIFEVKSVEYYTNLTVHIAALDKELRRVQGFLRSSIGLSWKQERDLAYYIDYAVAFKQAFKQGLETAKLTRSKSDKNWRYTLEIFDHADQLARSISYTVEVDSSRYV
ncbi:hypothetical protein [Ralstonia phage RP31]|uniref:Uncharacterized protein n=2 Tax=Ripduovirus RP12 TaxID=2560700 RepID=A0A1L7N0T1_9CAUD|nr:hypothetical protein FDH28_gp107 [Ralstonia phage RP12]BAW19081.1 hypothetical protein [Ralstonia phage RP12]BAW19367.1 hypothetical protein [Ralstonia phage RP31]